MRNPAVVLVAIVLVLTSFAAQASDEGLLRSNDTGLWAIDSSEQLDRWIEIHNLKEGLDSGIFHIDVIARKKGDPVWKIQHLAPHMAITLQALLASIRQPLTRGAVYPEAFNNAYAVWTRSESRPVCRTTVLECL